MYETAKRFAKGGCNCIPVDPKTKKPMVAWARWQRETVPSIELAAMFERAEGIAVVCGAVSGGLEVIDFDEPGVFPFWKALIREQTLKKLLVQRTQSGGFHVAYRCPNGIGRNLKLAMQGGKTAIETRGQGGYIIAAPSPGYEVVSQGSWDSLSEVTNEERGELSDAAKVFDEEDRITSLRSLDTHRTTSIPPVCAQDPSLPQQVGGRVGNRCEDSMPEALILRPGDDFERRTSWEEILQPHGWKKGDTKDGTTYWTRPGKRPSVGHSATTNFRGDDCLYVFSQNAKPFDAQRSYTKLKAYCLLNFAGDFRATIAGLRDAGYGKRELKLKCERTPFPSIDIGAIDPIEEVEFWWRPYLPKGKAVLLDGDSGTRKTTLILSLAAAFSNGVDPVSGSAIPPVRTLYFGKEDTPQELGTVYQANKGRTGFMDVYPEAFSLTPKSVENLARKIEQDGWNVIVFDAYLYFLEGIVRDSNSSVQEIKSVTQALQEVYAATGASGIHIRHTTKNYVGKAPAAMGVGSYQFRASHRGQLLVRQHPTQRRDIVVADCKGNLLVEQGAMFGVERLGNEMRFYSVDSDPFAERCQKEEQPPTNSAALGFLKRTIRGGEEKYASDVFARAKECGVSKSALQRANRTLGVQQTRDGKRWKWRMPDPFD